ncbi:hypothetical protein PspLS_02763 [Pyricularia sp. CBS 133598]|nr:hypothetical protein PspLS_02763 [Pyricularia sp. CBS 133598]
MTTKVMTTKVETQDPQVQVDRRSKYHEADVVVVGAGVFGCAIAYALANQGRSILLLERWMHEPDRIVGELLQPGGVASLKKLGLGHCLDGIDAQPCYGYHVMHKGDEVAIPYPYMDDEGCIVTDMNKKQIPTDDHVNGHANGHTNGHANGHANGNGHMYNGGYEKLEPMATKPEGRSFHHGRLITNLRKSCLAHKNITVVETEVTATIRGTHTPQVLGVEARTTDKSTGKKHADCFFGQLTIIADGYASKFRKQYISRAPIVRSKFYALELIDCPLPPYGYGHVVIGEKHLALLYQIGSHETRALIDVPENLPAASPANGGVRGYLHKVVIPSLPESVRPSALKALSDGKIPRSMPNSWLPPTPQTQHEGILILGDAMNMRHPLTGGGMTVAFNDALLVAELLDPDVVPSLSDTAAVRAAMKTFHWRRKSLTSIVNVLAQALYSLFAASDWRLDALRRGCFEYFQRGITDEPCAMLAGLLESPTTLAYHFFSVAFIALWLHLSDSIGSPMGLWKLPMVLIECVMILWKACVVFLPVMWAEAA